MAILPSTQLLQSHKVIFFRFVIQNFILEKYIIKKEDAFLLLLMAFHSPEKMPNPKYRFTQSLGRIISQKTSVTIQAKEVMPQNVMFVIMSKIASIQDVIKKHLPLFTSIDAIILSSVNPMTLCNLEMVVREIPHHHNH